MCEALSEVLALSCQLVSERLTSSLWELTILAIEAMIKSQVKITI